MAKNHGPPIKDDERHEALRKQGARRAQELDIEGRSRMSKGKLIDAISHP